MIELPSLINLIFDDSSFGKLKELRLEGLPQLSTITIGNNCFGNVKTALFESGCGSEVLVIELNQLTSIRIGDDCLRTCKTITVSDSLRLRVIDIGERSLTKCQRVAFLDLPVVEECNFSNRVFSKVEEVRFDSKNGSVVLHVDISSELELALQVLQYIVC